MLNAPRILNALRVHSIRSFILLCLLILPSLVLADLPPPIMQAIQQAGISPQEFSLVLIPADQTQNHPQTPASVLSHEAQRPRQVASVMKLLVSIAAIERLGLDFRWHTGFYAGGALQPQTTDSNQDQTTISTPLWIKADGDPTLDIPQLLDVMATLRSQHQLDSTCCDFVVDNSAYAAMPTVPAFDAQPWRGYNAPVQALMFQQQTLRLKLVPQSVYADGRLTDKVHLVSYPYLAGFRVRSALQLVPGNCQDWKQGLQLQIQDNMQDKTTQPEPTILPDTEWVLSGKYPAACGEKYLDMAIPDGASYLARAWQTYWSDSASETRRPTYAAVPNNNKLLTEAISPPLSELLVRMNKPSNNLLAKALFLAIGRYADKAQPKPASYAASTEAVRQWLKQKNLQFDELQLENGSGLSRHEQISAEHLAALLQMAWGSPYAAEMIASLPLLGVDGTLESRKASPFFGRAHLKSGSIEGVRALAGYVQDRTGQTWVLVCIVNSARATNSGLVQDAILKWLETKLESR